MWMGPGRSWVSVCRDQPDANTGCAEDVKEVEAAMQSEIQTLPWMSARRTKKGAHQAARHRQKIGYSDACVTTGLEIVRGTKSQLATCIMV